MGVRARSADQRSRGAARRRRGSCVIAEALHDEYVRLSDEQRVLLERISSQFGAEGKATEVRVRSAAKETPTTWRRARRWRARATSGAAPVKGATDLATRRL